jgi:hypothetical protein
VGSTNASTNLVAGTTAQITAPNILANGNTLIAGDLRIGVDATSCITAHWNSTNAQLELDQAIVSTRNIDSELYLAGPSVFTNRISPLAGGTDEVLVRGTLRIDTGKNFFQQNVLQPILQYGTGTLSSGGTLAVTLGRAYASTAYVVQATYICNLGSYSIPLGTDTSKTTSTFTLIGQPNSQVQWTCFGQF